jgi:hypothetical protein
LSHLSFKIVVPDSDFVPDADVGALASKNILQMLSEGALSFDVVDPMPPVSLVNPRTATYTASAGSE